MNTSSHLKHSAWEKTRASTVALAVIVRLCALGPAGAEASPGLTNAFTQGETDSGKGLPLPLHQFEGKGGYFATSSARLVNPPRDGEPVGRPSIGFAYINLGHSRSLEALTLTETPLKRLELGYGWNHLELGDLPVQVEETLGIRLRNSAVELHNFNARLQLLAEGDFEQPWLPGLTFGVTYKYNPSVKEFDEDLGGALSRSGLAFEQGADFTIYVGKRFRQSPVPFAINVGGRLTRGAEFGLLGFTENYSAVFEANIVISLTPRLLMAAEYHQAPNAFRPLGNLVQPEDDLWTVAFAYIISRHFTVALGYGHLGRLLNHTANGSWGITTKWEF